MSLGERILGQFARPHGAFAGLFGIWMNRGNRALNHEALAQLGDCGGAHVLEVGFGGGATLARLLAPAVAARVAGLDASRAMVERAARVFGPAVAAGRLEIRLGTAESLPWPDAIFDAALSVNSLFYWPDPHAALRELCRVLRPGGRLVLGLRSPATVARLGAAGRSLHAPDGIRLCGWLQEAGFAAANLRHHAAGMSGDFLIVSAHRPARH